DLTVPNLRQPRLPLDGITENFKFGDVKSVEEFMVVVQPHQTPNRRTHQNQKKGQRADPERPDRPKDLAASESPLFRRLPLLLLALLQFGDLLAFLFIFRVFWIAQIAQQQLPRPLELILGMNPNRPALFLGFDQIRNPLDIEEIAKSRRAGFIR